MQPERDMRRSRQWAREDNQHILQAPLCKCLPVWRLLQWRERDVYEHKHLLHLQTDVLIPRNSVLLTCCGITPNVNVFYKMRIHCLGQKTTLTSRNRLSVDHTWCLMKIAASVSVKHHVLEISFSTRKTAVALNVKKVWKAVAKNTRCFTLTPAGQWSFHCPLNLVYWWHLKDILIWFVGALFSQGPSTLLKEHRRLASKKYMEVYRVMIKLSCCFKTGSHELQTRIAIHACRYAIMSGKEVTGI